MKSKPTPPHQWQQRQRMILGTLSFLVICVVLVNVILFAQRAGTTSDDLPTAIPPTTSLTHVAFAPGTLTETAPPSTSTAPVAADAAALIEETATTGVSTDQPPSSTTAVVSSSQSTPVPTTPPFTASAAGVSSVRALPTSTGAAFIATSVETLAPAPLPSSEPTMTMTPALAVSPVPTQMTAEAIVIPPDMAGAVSIDTPLDVGIGQLRVIEATRRAESRIRELGGSMPAAPANQSWVLIEALLVCQDKTACAVSMDSFSIVGSSGQHYSASLQLNITPTLGSVVSNGQMWGYLGFVIPNSEKRLYFVMSHLSQKHVFIIE